jgi:hypothetical protein
MTDTLPDRIKKAIDGHVSDNQDDTLRTHLGISLIGRKCARELFYIWRHAHRVKHIGRIVRLFERGDETEPRMIRWLETAGFKIQAVDPETGEQFLVSTHGGFYGGHSDGKIVEWPEWFTGEPIDGPGLFECKTHNTKSFANLVNKGLISAKPEHYVQMQEYMHFMGLKWGLYSAINKNDDDLHFEVVAFKPELGEYYTEKALKIVTATKLPPGISKDPAWWECKFCDFSAQCHQGAEVHKSCRSCLNVEPRIVDGRGEWFCHHYGTTIPEGFVRKGCESWTRGL